MRDWKVLTYDPSGPSFWELAEQALSSTQKGYDLIASKFDHTPYCTSSEILDVMADQFEALGPFESTLDICCGTGAMSQVILPHCTESLVGYDLSAGMMKVAREKLSDLEKSDLVTFVQGVALDLPFDNQFDLVTNFGGLGHVMKKDVLTFIRQLHKVLKVGGKFVFITTQQPGVFDASFWRSYTFNTLIHLRNLLIKPPFIMYYLTFCLPRIQTILESEGFEVSITKDLFERPFQDCHLVVATKK